MRLLEGESLATAADRALAQRLGEEQRALVEELQTGVRVKASSWAGIIQFSEFELRIHPKLAGGDEGLAHLIDFVGGLDALSLLEAQPDLRLEGRNLLDLVALLFVTATRTVIRRGLVADYRGFEEDLPVVRGRLLGDRQLLRRFGQLDRIECRFDERTEDIVENRVILAALALLAHRVRNTAVAREARRLHAMFASACAPATRHEIDRAHAELLYHRLNSHYEPAHRLAWLIFDAFGFDELLAQGANRCFAFLIDMNVVFERFCERWITRLLLDTPWEVRAQIPCRSVLIDAHTGSSWKSVRPDLLISRRRRGGASLPVDAKYKLYDNRDLDHSDLYQLFLYAFAFAPVPSSEDQPPKGLIIFPASDSSGGERRRLRIRRISDRQAGAEVILAALPLTRALKEMRSQEQKLVEEFRALLTPLLSKL